MSNTKECNCCMQKDHAVLCHDVHCTIDYFTIMYDTIRLLYRAQYYFSILYYLAMLTSKYNYYNYNNTTYVSIPLQTCFVYKISGILVCEANILIIYIYYFIVFTQYHCQLIFY